MRAVVSPCRRRKTNLVSRTAEEWSPAVGRCRLCRSVRTRRSPGRLSVSSDDVLDEEPFELSWVSWAEPGGPPAARQPPGRLPLEEVGRIVGLGSRGGQTSARHGTARLSVIRLLSKLLNTYSFSISNM